MSNRLDRQIKWIFEISPVLQARRNLDVTMSQARELASRICDEEDQRAALALEREILASTSGYNAREIAQIGPQKEEPE